MEENWMGEKWQGSWAQTRPLMCVRGEKRAFSLNLNAFVVLGERAVPHYGV